MIDFFPDLNVILLWLSEYGSLVLFFMLALGIIALPIPEETLMTIAGILMHEGKLNIYFTALSAYAGAIAGITVSYLLGRTTGSFVVHKYGRFVGLGAGRIRKVHVWFERFGKWALVVGYFIPGIRHVTGFFAGTSELKYSHFALFAYSGALIWVSTFLLVGYFLGDYVFHIAESLETADWVILILVIFLLIAAIFVGYRNRKKILKK